MKTINETKRQLSDMEKHFILKPLKKISETKNYPIVVLTDFSHYKKRIKWSYKFVSNSSDGRKRQNSKTDNRNREFIYCFR